VLGSAFKEGVALRGLLNLVTSGERQLRSIPFQGRGSDQSLFRLCD